jgi:HAD superfamily hydrolase (TIGR01509 family)
LKAPTIIEERYISTCEVPAMAVTRALLIDLDGVIRTWRSQEDPNREREFGLPPGAIAHIAFAPERLMPAITGQIADPVWRGQITAELARQFPQANAVGAMAWWSASPGETVPEVVELVRAFRQFGPVVLVTNATTRLPDDLSRLGLTTLFDHMISSAVVGVAKPAPAIFTAALAAAGVAAAETLFVDDFPTNVAAAQALGIPAQRYVGVAELQAVLFAHRRTDLAG